MVTIEDDDMFINAFAEHITFQVERVILEHLLLVSALVSTASSADDNNTDNTILYSNANDLHATTYSKPLIHLQVSLLLL